MRWWWEEETRQVGGRFVPGAGHTGYSDRLHGGILLALFDEALAWACAMERGSFCYTGELTVRFHRASRLGSAMELAAWVVTARGRYVRAQGQALSADGALLATATGTYAALDRNESLQLRCALRFHPGDVDPFAGGGKGP
jgi:uncharacterized protein (TIGR00369 family)